jgi:hypothetical protein
LVPQGEVLQHEVATGVTVSPHRGTSANCVVGLAGTLLRWTPHRSRPAVVTLATPDRAAGLIRCRLPRRQQDEGHPSTI